MASISNIVSLQASDATIEGSEYTRASSTVSFPCSDDASELRALSPTSTFAASRGSSPAASLSAVLPSAASAASAAAEVNRRRKVLTSRPPNSFILYRSDKLRELVQKHPELKQTQISKMCADNWKKESAEVKEFYRRKQQEAKALFLSEQALEVERISGGSSDKGVIKRIQPTNTFIRYRTEMKKKLASQFATMNQKDVSRACGLMWRSEPEHVKMRYRQSYNKEKRDFERLCSSSTLSEQPSKEALSALASVMAEATKNSSAAASPSVTDKKRRLSEGCRSAPVSPPQPESVRSKRLRSFHTPSRSESAVTTPTDKPGAAEQPISLPSCASLLSMAGLSSLPARGSLSALSQPVSHFHKQPEHLRHALQAPSFPNYPANALPSSSSHFYLPPPHHHMMPHPPFNVHN
ncbi:hypothetical protein EV183_005248 [Coemansia sp. RSA 2336]|nr:hypothetical protein EV183_005248 [Coemansia sp. RSA 2336]